MNNKQKREFQKAVNVIQSNRHVQLIPKDQQGAIDIGVHPCAYCYMCTLGWDDDCQEDCKYLKQYYGNDNG